MLLSSSPISLGFTTVSRMFSMGWVPCRGDRFYSRPGVATDIASETHGRSVSFLASASDSDRWSNVGHLKHGIGPFICITSIQHRLSQLSASGQVLGTMSFPILICQTR
ncbi:hypothetical protein TNCV_3007201 [Trichonephila clavipes]|nr:hypothetical protein TNCV_3007201 [Trichonephila clavipes]